MAITFTEKKEILNFISNFSSIAKKEKWAFNYDADSDSLAIRARKLSKDARKKYLNDEFAFYINDRKNEVEGIFIEYFVSNFVSHHEDFKAIVKNIKKDIETMKKEDRSVVELNQEEVKKLVPELESVIINSILPNKLS